ncbi:hypothetical protein ACH5RR_008554 [Cinchona calisaya]|uniref:Uncharacterized protein n=1 Tax=Cinchona calisaya TaxID=153742 RepID=A0ABD3AFI5_9GENT
MMAEKEKVRRLDFGEGKGKGLGRSGVVAVGESRGSGTGQRNKSKSSSSKDDDHLNHFLLFLDKTEFGHVGKLERFSYYVAKQIGFKDGNECP